MTPCARRIAGRPPASHPMGCTQIMPAVEREVQTKPSGFFAAAQIANFPNDGWEFPSTHEINLKRHHDPNRL